MTEPGVQDVDVVALVPSVQRRGAGDGTEIEFAATSHQVLLSMEER